MTHLTFHSFISFSYCSYLRKTAAVCLLALSLSASVSALAQDDVQSAEEYLLNAAGEDDVGGNEIVDSSLGLNDVQNSDEASDSDIVPLMDEFDKARIIVDSNNAPESLINVSDGVAETPDIELPVIPNMVEVDSADTEQVDVQVLIDDTDVVSPNVDADNIISDDIPMPVASQNVLAPSEKVLVRPVKSSPEPVAVKARGPRVNQGNVMKVVPNNGLFFDSSSSGTQGEIAKKKAIRKVNPGNEAASKLIIVKKNASKNSQNAKLVAADRALALGRYDAAYALYSKLYDINSRDQAVLMGRAIALQKMGRNDAAVHAYQELIDINPDVLEAHINMLGLLGQRYPAVASQRLKALYDNNSGNAGVLAQLAINEANIGRYDEALQYLATASGYEPHNANHIYNMGVVADLSGDVKKAVQYYEQALETDSIHGGGRSIPRESVFARLAQLR